MRTSSGDQPPTLQPHYRVYAAVVSRRTPVARVCQAWCAGQNALIPCRHVPEPAGNSTRRWDALRITARRRRTLTSGPRAGRRVSMATGQELVRRPGNPVQREPGLPPELALGGDRGPIRVVWTTQEPDTHASRSGETPLRGAEALEAMPPSTAVPKRCRGARLLGFSSGRSCCEHLRNLQRPVASSSCRSGKRPRCRSDRPPRWVALPTVPFASCRSEIRAAADCRLPEQVDVRRCRFVRAPRRPGASTAGVSGFHEGSGHADGSLKNRLRADVTEATGSATRAGIR
jgi:hypothetical protein